MDDHQGADKPAVGDDGGAARTSQASPANLPESEVLAIARLANLDLDAEELARLTRDLGNILTYVRALEELDVSGIQPTAHVQIDRLPLRADELVPSLPRELALGEAPAIEADGFAVPAFVDEG